MNNVNFPKSPVSSVQFNGLRRGASLLFLLGLVTLALPGVVLGAGPQDVEAVDPDRLAAVLRFYTDRYEREAHSDSAEYRAMSLFLSQGPVSGEFGGIEDPARWAAVERFYGDRHEGAASGDSAQFDVLARSLSGGEPIGVADSLDWARLAAVVRFYTDQYERAANADSEEYKAMSTYLSEMGLADGFSGPADAARMAAVTRFYTDRYERSAAAGDARYAALARSLGIEGNRFESRPIVALTEDDPAFGVPASRQAAVSSVVPEGPETSLRDDPAFGGATNSQAELLVAVPWDFEAASSRNDPAYGAWSSAEAEWLACNGSGVRDLLCSAEGFGATP